MLLPKSRVCCRQNMQKVNLTLPLPTFNLQTRTQQKKTLEHSTSWAYHVWLLGVERPANEFYPQARVGDRVYVVALFPYPFVPFVAVRSADPFRDGWLQMLLWYRNQEQEEHRIIP